MCHVKILRRRKTCAKLARKTKRDPKTGRTIRTKYYYIRYKDPNTGKFIFKSTGQTDTREAEKVLVAFINGLQNKSEQRCLLPSEMPVAQVLDDYAKHKMGEKCAERLSYSFEHILNFWGNDFVSEVNIERVKQYCQVNERAAGTLKRELNDLRAAINHAISMNRLHNIKFPKAPLIGAKREKYLTRNELASLLREARKLYRSSFALTLFIIIAYYSGARKSAIMNLRWEKIDFNMNILDFRDLENNHGNKHRACIPMPPKLRDFLLRRYKHYGQIATYVFHQKDWPEKRIKSIDRAFRKASTNAKLKDTTPHTLRHTRVSELAQSGEKIPNISAYMAMSEQTVWGVYTHVNNEDVNDMAKRIGRSQKIHKIS